MRCEETLALMDDYVEGELGSQAEARLRSHLSECVDCEEQHQSLRREQEIYSRYLLGIETTPALWANLRKGIENEQALRDRGFRSRLNEWFGSAFRVPSLVPALATIIIISAAGIVFVAKQSFSPDEADVATSDTQFNGNRNNRQPPEISPTTEPPPEVKKVGGEGSSPNSIKLTTSGRGFERKSSGKALRATGTESTESLGAWVRGINAANVPAREARILLTAGSAKSVLAAAVATEALDSEASRHAQKAEMLLRSFRNSRAARPGSGVDVSYEKRQSRELIVRNILLRREAQTDGDLPTEGLLSRLEPILIDIANLPKRVSSYEVRQITEQMRKEEIVSALHLHSSQTSPGYFQ